MEQQAVITVDCFRVKALLRDPAFYVSIAPLLAAQFPDVAAWFDANRILLAPLLLVLGGHFLVRMRAAAALGQATAAVGPEIARANTLWSTGEPSVDPIRGGE